SAIMGETVSRKSGGVTAGLGACIAGVRLIRERRDVIGKFVSRRTRWKKRLRRITNFAGLRTARIELACRTDFRRCHPARDVAHLLADVVTPGAGREGFELSAQIDRRLSLEPRSAGFAVDFAVTGPTRRDAAQGCPAC